MIQYYKQEIEKVRNQLIDHLKDTKFFKIINSIPGFGEFSTTLFLVKVGHITRFNERKQFISFIGIDSVTSQSGVSAYHGSIFKTGNKFARTILFNIITTILQISARSNQTNPIYLFFRKK
ncbi:MAG: IS110 family transposase [Bacilli bacterium]